MGDAELLAERTQRWDLEYGDEPTLAEVDEAGNRVMFNALLGQIEYFADRRFDEYAPTATGPFLTFMERLEGWVGQVPDEQDQKGLLRLAMDVFFIGAQEFAALYRTAYNGEVGRWVIDQLDLRLDDPGLRAKMDAALNRTWFCGITDSMQIASFCHVNRITSFELRPDWRSMAQFSEPNAIAKYIKDKQIERLVLLEDFVGSGTQMAKAIQFATDRFPQLPILFVPLIIAQRGLERARAVAAGCARLKLAPILVLPHTALVAQVLTAKHPRVFRLYRDLCTKLCSAVSNGGVGSPMSSPYGPLGFKQTGGLVVMYTNCPNNTLPIIHHQSNWNPLFPRSARV